MSLKVVLVGAGSAVFARPFIQDLFLSALEDVELRLVEPQGERLRQVEVLVQRLAEAFPRRGVRARPMDLGEALPGSDVVVLAADVGGDTALRQEYQVALGHGVDQTIGDTLGPGGLMKFLRNAPLVDAIGERFEGRLVLNYTNPLSPLTALLWAWDRPALGLCHSVPQTAKTLAGYLGLSPEEVSYKAAGVNHLSWLVELKREEEDLYPRLRALGQGPLWWKDPVRFELLRLFGLFPTESSAHVSEYVPYFRKTPEAFRAYFAPGTPGSSGYYAQTHSRLAEESLRALGEAPPPGGWSGEWAVPILEGLAMGRRVSLYATVPNRDHVPQLLPGPVEVPVVLEGTSWRAERVSLPPGPAALSRRSQEVHLLYLEGYLRKDPGLLLQGLALDPLTGAVLDLRGVEALFRDLVRTQAPLLPAFLAGI
ncbi:glycosyl hydrolase family 4 [Thermus sp.]|uniref:family 4 glycosyl hydrolase n=1 Tax=Thermus sp. TaxID=275 RepID=UPI0025F484F4|nr:glycosyl hydrolase family 4 [Thermus sp.]MCS6869778.1 glycosyl hydrolase family 4 [Thermus sp.]MDW8358756.1 glycosyl hydrolase family 4 [Thermus sp.]